MHYIATIVKSIICLLMMISKCPSDLPGLSAHGYCRVYKQIGAFCRKYDQETLNCIYQLSEDYRRSNPCSLLATFLEQKVYWHRVRGDQIEYNPLYAFDMKCIPHDLVKVEIYTDEKHKAIAYLPRSVPVYLLFILLKDVAKNVGYDMSNQHKHVVNVGDNNMYLPNPRNIETKIQIPDNIKLAVSAFEKKVTIFNCIREMFIFVIYK